MSPDDAERQDSFLVLCVIGALAILSSTMSKNPVLNPFAESLGTPDAYMGFVAAASTIPGVMISLPAGSFSDILGRKKVLITSNIVFASAPFLYILVSSWWQLILIRFYHGFATAVFVPVMRAMISDHYPSKKGERISMFTSATIVGRSIAPFLGGFILSVTLWDFRTLYLAVGIAGVTALLTTFLLLKEKDQTSEHGLPETPRHTCGEKRHQPTRRWKDVFGNFGIMVPSAIEAAAYYVYGALEFFLAGYLKNVALLDPSFIGVILGMQLALIPVVSPFMGRLSDRVGRTIPITAGLLIGGFPLLIIPYTTHFPILLAISVTYGLGFAMVTSSTPALVGDLSSKEHYGAAMGLLATIMDIGQMLGPIVTGIILATFGYSGSFISLGAILLCFCAFFTMFRRLFPS